MAKEYALYHGDTFITLGTVNEIAAETGIKRESITFYGTPTYIGRREKVKESKGMYLVKFDDTECGCGVPIARRNKMGWSTYMNEQRFQTLERIHHLLSGESDLSDKEINEELAKCGAILEADTLQARRSRGVADVEKERGGRKKGVPLSDEAKAAYSRRNKSRNSFITKEFLEEQYALGKNNFEIAHEFGVGSPSTVAWYSRKLGAKNPFYHIGKVKK